MATPERRTVRFVTALVRGAVAIDDLGGGYRVKTDGASVRLDGGTVTALIGQGILGRRGKQLVCRPEARTWLRRMRATTDNAYADQHRVLSASTNAPTINLNESPVARLATGSGRSRDPFLAPHHTEAARRLHNLFEKAQLRRAVTLSYDENRTGSGGSRAPATTDISDMAVDARRQLDRVRQVLPRDCAIAVYDVCCLEKGLQQVESEQGWPRRSAKLVLRIGLEQVAAHFGLSHAARGPATAGKRARQWRDHDARPTVVG